MQKLINKLSEITDFEFTILYYNNQRDSKIEFTCDKGHIFHKSRRNAQSSITCPMCNKDKVTKENSKKFKNNTFNKITYTTESVSEFMSNFGYTLLSEYKQANAHLNIKCPNNHEYPASWSKFMRGRRCPICAKDNKRKQVEKQVNNFLEKTESFLLEHKLKLIEQSSYVNRNVSELIVKCENDHTTTIKYSQLYDNYIPFCTICEISLNKSSGEREMSKTIQGLDVEFETEWHFNKHPQLKGTGTTYLRFDFFLPDYNLVIEYDGEQHFKDIPHWSSLKSLQRRDQIKNQFCLDNNIRLLRIPYTIKPTEELILYYINKNFTIVSAI